MGTDREALELPTSIVKRLRSAVYSDCNTFATPNRFKQKSPPDLWGGPFKFWQHALVLGVFASFQAKTPVFCGLDRTRTCDLTDVNGAF